MQQFSPKSLVPIVKWGLLLGALLYIGIFLYLAFFRLRYPFELEWMEGATVDHVRRILAGQKLYVPPSLAFTPHNYPPLYYYLSAGVAKMLGIGFLPLRLVSFISSLGCFVVIFLLVKHETRETYCGLLASSLYAATFEIGGAWFDVARIDALFLLLLLIGVYLLRLKPTPVYLVLSGLCFALSCLTKQTALAISLPIAAYLLLKNWRQGLAWSVTVGAVVGGSTLWLDVVHAGWYRYFVFALPTQHAVRHHYQWIRFWQKDILLPLGIACCLVVLYFGVQLLRASKADGLFYLAVTVGMFGGAWFSRLHAGAFNNTLLPAYASIAILFGLAFSNIFKYLHLLPERQQAWMRLYLYGICLLQFFILLYNPLKQLPTEQDIQAGRRLVALMEQVNDEVLLPRHGYLPVLAGKHSNAQEIAINDILRCSDENPTTKRLKTKLTNEIKHAIRHQRFQAIILDHSSWYSELLNTYYEAHGPVFKNDQVFWPVTGYQTRPEMMYVPQTAE